MAPSKQDKSKEKGKEKVGDGNMKAPSKEADGEDTKAPPSEDRKAFDASADRKMAASYDGDTKKPPPMAKEDAKMPASSRGTNKDSSAIKPSIVSPPRGRRSKLEIMRSQTALPGWYIRSCLVQGGVEVITITTQSMVDDAFFQNLVKEISAGPKDGPIAKLFLLGAFSMRVSLNNPEPLLNVKVRFQRKAFIRVLDEGEMGQDSRLEGLKVIKQFLEEPRNNMYKAAVFIQQPGWDTTPTDKEMPKLDHFLLYGEIVKVLGKMFDNVNGSWASENWSAAECFFTEGHIPIEAVKDLGFPLDKVG